MKRRKLGEDEVTLPRGSRVITRVDALDDAGRAHPKGSFAVVREVAHHTYVVETPGGARLTLQRDQLRLQKQEHLAALGRRQWEHRKLQDDVILATVVGSRAWGLDEQGSDVDVRGCFVLPFEAHASLWDAPDEIHGALRDEVGEAAYWEVEKLVHQGLRADANTLEMLWSPLVREATPLGRSLVDERRMFVSINVLGSFGRYATSQLEKVRRSLARDRALHALLDEVEAGRVSTEQEAAALLPPSEKPHALVRSLFDRGLLEESAWGALVRAVHEHGAARLRPEEVRPKNAYNLLRLLHSCVSWLQTGEPLIRVEGPLRDVLLSIKRGETPIERTLALAEEAARRVEDAAAEARLPESPDHEAAERFLQACRRQAARFALSLAPAPSGAASPIVAGVPGDVPRADVFAPTLFPAPLPPDVDVASTKRFLLRFVDGDLSMRPRAFLIVALTGAHAYGFPSPDSDLDLKAVDACPADLLLGLAPPPRPVEHVEVFEGREMDLSSHEAGLAVALLLKGNGNMLERLLGPMPLVVTPAGERLAALAREGLSRRVVHHYRGFFHRVREEYAAEERRGVRRAKRLLYAYRVALTGAHCLLHGEIETDVRVLAERHGFPRVEALVARKREAEKVALSAEEAALWLDDMPALERLLDDALARSPLPEAPRNEDAFHRFLVDVRLALSARA